MSLKLPDVLDALRRLDVRLVTGRGGPARFRAPRVPPRSLVAAARTHRDVLPAVLRLTPALGIAVVRLLAELVDDRRSLPADILDALGLLDPFGLACRVEDELSRRGAAAAVELVETLFEAETRCDAIALARIEGGDP